MRCGLGRMACGAACRITRITRIAVLVAGAAVAAGVFLAGCGKAGKADLGADQSLVAIGEGALERAEAMENKAETADANISYRRALWAFRYHEQLTGEEPLLLDEALDGIERTTSKRRE